MPRLPYGFRSRGRSGGSGFLAAGLLVQSVPRSQRRDHGAGLHAINQSLSQGGGDDLSFGVQYTRGHSSGEGSGRATPAPRAGSRVWAGRTPAAPPAGHGDGAQHITITSIAGGAVDCSRARWILERAPPGMRPATASANEGKPSAATPALARDVCGGCPLRGPDSPVG